jgi:hypothetical protein
VTPWTRLVIAEALELDLEDVLNGPPGDGLTDVDGQGFDGIEIEVESRPFLAIGAAGHNFPPPVRHVAEIGQIVGLTLGERHVVFVLELGERGNLGKSP